MDRHATLVLFPGVRLWVLVMAMCPWSSGVLFQQVSLVFLHISGVARVWRFDISVSLPFFFPVLSTITPLVLAPGLAKMVEKKRNAYNILIVAFVALGSFAFGYSNTIIGTTLAQPSFM